MPLLPLRLTAVLLPALVTLASASTPGTLPNRDSLIKQFLRQKVGTVPVSQATDEVREFTLEVRQVKTEISPGVQVEQWAFGFPGTKATVPGPELRVRQGDKVRITLVNTHHEPHTIHLHGITSLAQEMDGVPHTSQQVMPGQRFTYEFIANEAGTFAYHCHVQTNLHLDMGMYGALIVEPKVTAKHHQVEQVLVLDEWDSRQNPAALKHAPTPNFFLVNGKAHPSIPGVEVKPGQVGLLRLIHMGNLPHSLHLHGNNFLVIAKDGYDLPVPIQADTLAVFPGERYDLLVKGRDGAFPLHDHMLQHNLNDGVYPGGMHLLVQGAQALTATGKPAVNAAKHAQHPPAPVARDAPAVQLSPATPVSKPAGHSQHAPVPSSGASEIQVSLSMFGVNPLELRIKRGTTVTFVNVDRTGHTVTSGPPGGDPKARAFDSSGEAQGRQDVIYPGGSWSFKFDQPGEYEYHCIPHPTIRGRVIVE